MSLLAQSSIQISLNPVKPSGNSAKCCQKWSLDGSMLWKMLPWEIMSHNGPFALAYFLSFLFLGGGGEREIALDEYF